MLRKYRQLLLLESERLEPTANDVMLGRMFLNEERLQLKEDVRLATEDPGLSAAFVIVSVATHLENLEESGNLRVVVVVVNA